MQLSVATIKKISPMVIGGVLFLADRILKFFALHGAFAYFNNTGLIFSLPVGNTVAFIIGVLIWMMIVGWWYVNRYESALLLVMIGGASNLIDRLRYGGVIDYIFVIPTAPANMADLLIATGIVWFVWRCLSSHPR